jgi:outer membrane protein assembly factor BamB
MEWILNLTLAMLLLSLWMIPIYSQPEPNSPWPMFHHDPRHTGQSEFAGSPTGKLLWSYTIISTSAHSSPAISSDGTVYTGASPGMYALSPDGSLLWSYTTADRVDTAPLSARTAGFMRDVWITGFMLSLRLAASHGVIMPAAFP